MISKINQRKQREHKLSQEEVKKRNQEYEQTKRKRLF